MSKPTQATKAPTTTKAPAKTPPTPDTMGGTALAELPAGLFEVNGAPSLQGQTDRLSNARLQAVQRQLLAGQIGQQQGNGHLQQVMRFVKQNAPYQPNPIATYSTNGARQPLIQRQSPASTEPVSATPAADEELIAMFGDESLLSSAADAPPSDQAVSGQPLQRKEEDEDEAATTPVAAQEAPAQTEQQPAQTADQGDQPAQTDPAPTASAALTQAAASEPPLATTAAVSPASAAATGNASSPIAGATPALQNGAAPATTPGADDKAPVSPGQDPGFQAVTGAIKSVAAGERAHAPAAAKAGEAQAAAVAPAGELASKAQSNQVGEMAQAETPGFDAAGFKAKLMARIQALAPKSEKDADEFKESNKLDSLKGEMQGEASQQREAAGAPLAEKTNETPDTADIPPKAVTPVPPAQPGAPPPAVGAANAAPKPRGQGEIEAPMQTAGEPVDQQMAAANVTEAQLANANEPEFSAAVTAKSEAGEHSRQTPQVVRQAEQGQLTQAQGEATTLAQEQTAAMHSDRATLLGQVQGQQTQTKTQDEQKRAEIAADIQAIYAKTKTTVEQILNALDGKVAQVFDAGASAAQSRFENYVEAEMDKYKEKRYGGVGGKVLAVTDFLHITELPPEVNKIFVAGRNEFVAEMGKVIDQVVRIIGTELSQAKAAIADGKQEIQRYVAKLPQELQQVGQQAAGDIQGQFDELEQGVDAKQDALIDMLANKYQEKVQAVDAYIQQKQEENKSLWSRAKDKIGGVLNTILELKNMLLGVLAHAAAAVEQIIKDPIEFLGNLVSGVKLGLQNFVSNIGTHLKEGFIGWLTGAVASAGISLPQNWDLPGIFQFVMQLLGMTFESIMGKISQLFGFDVMSILEPVQQLIQLYQEEGFAGLIKAGIARLIGQERMEALLEVWQMIKTVISGNWMALWGMVQEHLSGLKEMVFGKIEEFLSERVIKAGITWIVSLLNPAGAFIKACKAIYDIVMFFVERGSQMMSLVNAVIGSVSAIAGGNLSAAAGAVENALAKGIPVAIGFLSSLLGLGNVTEKVQEVIQSVRGLVDRALNAVLNSGPVQMVVGFLKRVVGKIKGLIEGNLVDSENTTAARTDDEQQMADSRTSEQKDKDLLAGSTEAEALLRNVHLTMHQRQEKLPEIKSKYSMKSLKFIIDRSKGDEVAIHVHGEINPIYDGDGYLLDKWPPDEVVIESVLGPPQRRQHLEEILEPAAIVPGIPKEWQRLHSQGAGTGKESIHGIYYGPEKVNQELQNQGIEQFFRDIYKQKHPNATFHLRTVTVPHPGPPEDRLGEIT